MKGLRRWVLVLLPAALGAIASTGDDALGQAHLQTGCRIVGRVVDEAGRPVSGAKVEANRGSASITPKTWKSWTTFHDATTTDTDGRYVLKGLTEETYQVTAYPPEGSGLAPSRPRVGLVVDGELRCGDIVLVPGGSIEGTVKGSDGKPAPGTTVKLGEQSTATDERGHYFIGGLPTEGLPLRLTPPKGTPWAIKVVKGVPSLAKTRLQYDWVLREGVSVSGRVTNNHGEVVAGVTVKAHCGHSGAKEFEAVVRTDGNGFYHIRGLTGSQQLEDESISNHFYVRVLPEKEDLHIAVRRSIGAKLGQKVTQDFVLQRGGCVCGRVTDQAGQGVGGARVTVYSIDGKRKHHHGPGGHPRTGYFTDANGGFTVSQVPGGSVCVRVEPHKEMNFNLLAIEQKGVAVVAEETSQVGIVLKTGGSVTGVVGHPEKGPRTGATVRLIADFPRGTPGWDQNIPPVVTGADGRYRFTTLLGGKYRLSVQLPSGRDEVVSPTALDIVEGVETVHDLRVCQAAFLDVLVLDKRDKPLKGIFVIAKRAGLPFPAVWNGRYFQTSNEKGVARIGPLEPGQYAVIGRQRDAAGKTVRQSASKEVVEVQEGRQHKTTLSMGVTP